MYGPYPWFIAISLFNSLCVVLNTVYIQNITCNTFLSQPAVACNPELFPISHYFISIPGLAGNLTVPAVDSHTALSAALASSSFPRLVKESYYIINVQTCTAYVCGATPASVSVGRNTMTACVIRIILYCFLH